MLKHKIAVAVTGASGAIYARVLLDSLLEMDDQLEAVGLVMSSNAETVWQHELGDDSFSKYPFTRYGTQDFYAPFASGSAGYDALIICPCSMGTMGRIASGMSNDLCTRAADVMLKERKKCILLIRDTPYNLIHIRNMETVTLAGGVIVPASPSFYSKAKDFYQLAATVTDRALHLAGLQRKSYQWGE
ncbi:MAG: UbiX family flavin prenyltransferase [Chitinophagales bacterium]